LCCGGKWGGEEEEDAKHLNGRMDMRPNKTWAQNQNNQKEFVVYEKERGKIFSFSKKQIEAGLRALRCMDARALR
jgi:hypothetical protein